MSWFVSYVCRMIRKLGSGGRKTGGGRAAEEGRVPQNATAVVGCTPPFRLFAKYAKLKTT